MGSNISNGIFISANQFRTLKHKFNCIAVNVSDFTIGHLFSIFVHTFRNGFHYSIYIKIYVKIKWNSLNAFQYIAPNSISPKCLHAERYCKFVLYSFWNAYHIIFYTESCENIFFSFQSSLLLLFFFFFAYLFIFITYFLWLAHFICIFNVNDRHIYCFFTCYITPIAQWCANIYIAT